LETRQYRLAQELSHIQYSWKTMCVDTTRTVEGYFNMDIISSPVHDISVAGH
jgi:hypothetical protein